MKTFTLSGSVAFHIVCEIHAYFPKEHDEQGRLNATAADIHKIEDDVYIAERAAEQLTVPSKSSQ